MPDPVIKDENEQGDVNLVSFGTGRARLTRGGRP